MTGTVGDPTRAPAAAAASAAVRCGAGCAALCRAGEDGVWLSTPSVPVKWTRAAPAGSSLRPGFWRSCREGARGTPRMCRRSLSPRLLRAATAPSCCNRVFFFSAEEGARSPLDARWLALRALPGTNRRVGGKSENFFGVSASTFSLSLRLSMTNIIRARRTSVWCCLARCSIIPRCSSLPFRGCSRGTEELRILY